MGNFGGLIFEKLPCLIYWYKNVWNLGSKNAFKHKHKKAMLFHQINSNMIYLFESCGTLYYNQRWNRVNFYKNFPMGIFKNFLWILIVWRISEFFALSKSKNKIFVWVKFTTYMNSPGIPILINVDMGLKSWSKARPNNIFWHKMKRTKHKAAWLSLLLAAKNLETK